MEANLEFKALLRTPNHVVCIIGTLWFYGQIWTANSIKTENEYSIALKN